MCNCQQQVEEAAKPMAVALVKEFKDKLIDIAITNLPVGGCVTSNQIIELERTFWAETHPAFTPIHQQVEEAVKIDENTSDGYHTFKELYQFRLLYNAHLFNEWSKQGMYDVHKSTKHSDGEDCFGGGWFIVVASLPSGDISNHYEMKDWDLFDCHIRQTAKEWDGHTSQDVAQRLREAL